MRRAPRRSRPAACSRTTPRFTCCSDGFISRRGTRHRRRRSCGVRCGSIHCCRRRTGSSVTRSSRWDALARPSRAGTNGIGWPRAARKRKRSGQTWSGRGKPPGCSRMADDIRGLSAQLAQDPQSLVFLRLGEALRRKGQLEAALRVAMNGLERHPHVADAHDLYARILTDKHDYERAFDEWDMAGRIAPHPTRAAKRLAFLYFKVGDIEQAEAHLAAAQRVEPNDPSIEQAFEMMRKGRAPPAPTAATAEHAPAPTAMPAATVPTAASPLDESRV